MISDNMELQELISVEHRGSDRQNRVSGDDSETHFIQVFAEIASETTPRRVVPTIQILNDDIRRQFESRVYDEINWARLQHRLNTSLLDAVHACNPKEVQRLLDAGANPNATCHTEYISAVHIAAMYNNEILSVLLRRGAERQRVDRFGRTPLHLAASSGNILHIATLLSFPPELQEKLQNEDITAETERNIIELREDWKDIIDIKCRVNEENLEVPDTWKDEAIHDCKDIQIPLLEDEWTALHAASSHASARCCRLLLAAGAWPDETDASGYTPLQVLGSAYHIDNIHPERVALLNNDFTEVIKLLLVKTCDKQSMDVYKLTDTLHKAVELENLEAIELLLATGIPPIKWNKDGLTPLHVCVEKKLKRHLKLFTFSCHSSAMLVNLKDSKEQTVLFAATANDWYAGVCVALEAIADVAIGNASRQTPLHEAATRGNAQILKELLNCPRSMGVINNEDYDKMTPLFQAVVNGHYDCVKMLYERGVLLYVMHHFYGNILHLAAQKGNVTTLQLLIDNMLIDKRQDMINHINDYSYTPLHIAVADNHEECVKLLISHEANLKIKAAYRRGYTPLHFAAQYNYDKIAKALIEHDSTTLDEIDDMHQTPLHTAVFYMNQEVIVTMICNGADLSLVTSSPDSHPVTAIGAIMNNLLAPIELLESIFDTCISYTLFPILHYTYQEPVKLKMIVDFSVLCPVSSEKPLDAYTSVLEALLETGNRHKQKRLLLHPLLESYVILKWNALLPFLCLEFGFYVAFVLTLTIFVTSEYFYRDNKIEEKPLALNTIFWMCALYITTIFVSLLEFFSRASENLLFLRHPDTWMRVVTIVLAFIVPSIVINAPQLDEKSLDWPRLVAAVTVLLASLNLTYFLANITQWGYFILMFLKVSRNVLKILLIFALVIAGFSLSFMIQLHSQSPFDNPWTAFVKTMVMMTSEFDYSDVFKTSDSDGIGHSVAIRTLFLIFLILAAIVLMNLMVGVAVNELNNLEEEGRIMQLERQIELLSSLKYLLLKWPMIRLFRDKLRPKTEEEEKGAKIVLMPFNSTCKYNKILPRRVINGLYEKIHNRRMRDDEPRHYMHKINP